MILKENITIFYLEKYEKTGGIHQKMKNQISHRGKAFRSFFQKIALYIHS